VPPQIVEIQALIDVTKQMIGRNVMVDVEGVEESFLAAGELTHHAQMLRSPRRSE
jgi:hypothetical protein